MSRHHHCSVTHSSSSSFRENPQEAIGTAPARFFYTDPRFFDERSITARKQSSSLPERNRYAWNPKRHTDRDPARPRDSRTQHIRSVDAVTAGPNPGSVRPSRLPPVNGIVTPRVCCVPKVRIGDDEEQPNNPIAEISHLLLLLGEEQMARPPRFKPRAIESITSFIAIRPASNQKYISRSTPGTIPPTLQTLITNRCRNNKDGEEEEGV